MAAVAAVAAGRASSESLSRTAGLGGACTVADVDVVAVVAVVVVVVVAVAVAAAAVPKSGWWWSACSRCWWRSPSMLLCLARDRRRGLRTRSDPVLIFKKLTFAL